MYLTHTQFIVLDKIIKSNGNILYCDLHSCRKFKSDFALQSAVQYLRENDYILYGVPKINPKFFSSKSSDDDMIRDYFEEVNYLTPHTRLFITSSGHVLRDEYRYFKKQSKATLIISVISLFVSFLSLLSSCK
nr:MAG TPA: hypothetical protein [Caudoviricetes sp.]